MISASRHRLVYGFSCDQLGGFNESYESVESDDSDERGSFSFCETYRKRFKFSSPVSKVCYDCIMTLLAIRWFRSSMLSPLDKNVVILIARIIWNDRHSYIPLDTFYLPMYGTYQNEPYYGFEYTTVCGLFESPPYVVVSGKNCCDGLSIVTADPPKQIANLYQKHFPNLKPHSFALIDNVYTSHYATGDIMFGFFCKDKDIYDANDLEVHAWNSGVVAEIAHCYKNKNNNDFDYFCGIKLFEGGGGIECPEDAIKFAEMLQRRHVVPKRHRNVRKFKEFLRTKLFSEDIHSYKFQTEYPVITFVPQMCHCCT